MSIIVIRRTVLLREFTLFSSARGSGFNFPASLIENKIGGDLLNPPVSVTEQYKLVLAAI